MVLRFIREYEREYFFNNIIYLEIFKDSWHCESLQSSVIDALCKMVVNQSALNRLNSRIMREWLLVSLWISRWLYFKVINNSMLYFHRSLPPLYSRYNRFLKHVWFIVSNQLTCSHMLMFLPPIYYLHLLS